MCLRIFPTGSELLLWIRNMFYLYLMPLAHGSWFLIHLLIDVVQHWLRFWEMRNLLHYRSFEKWPTSDKPPLIIFLANLRTYWKVRWWRPILYIWSLEVSDGWPQLLPLSTSIAYPLTHSICSFTLALPRGRHVAMASTASNDTLSLMPGHSPW